MTATYRNDLLQPFLALDQGEKVQAECKLQPPPTANRADLIADVWIDGDGGLRSKTTVRTSKNTSQLPH